MSTLLAIKQYITNFIGKFEVYIKPVGKLILALIVLFSVNNKLGYMQKIDNTAVVLIAALMCSFMPTNFIVLVAAVFILLHMYALSMECAVVVLVLFLVLFLLYFRLSPKDTIVVAITPILTSMGIPYAVPIAAGLAGGPASAASVGCGVIVGYVLKTVNECAPSLSQVENSEMALRFRFIIDSILDNKQIVLLIIAFTVTIFVMYIITSLPIDYSWTIAIIVGAVLEILLVLIGDAALDTSISAGGVIIGTILAVIAGFIAQFFLFNVDYTRTEKLQFQDDHYVYYVKAVPKKTVAAPSRRVKQINSSNVRRRPQAQRPHTETRLDDSDD